jgi:hypothetical protein
MLTFFRRIRKGLLGSGQARKPASSPVPSGTEGKVERYLLYAIGEIALVVIGILIALQINNWNEWRKDRKTELEVLQELNETLLRNTEELKSNIELTSTANQSRDLIIALFSQKSSYSDTLGRHFFRSGLISDQSVLDHSGYEMLKNEGFDLIRSASLRKQIVNLFEIDYVDLQINETEEFWNVYVEELLVYGTHNFTDRRTPKDINSLLQDSYFAENLKAIREHEDWLNHLRNTAFSETQKVLRLIKEELDQE